MMLSIPKLVANLSIYGYEYEENTWYFYRSSIQKYRTYSIPKYDTNWKIELVEWVKY